jgi:hypothetical protein
MNGTDYQNLYDPSADYIQNDNLTHTVTAGDANGNTGENGFQVGFDAPSQKFAVNTTVHGLPDNAQPYQLMGIQVGTGHQSNHLKLVVTGQGADGADDAIEFGKDEGAESGDGSWDNTLDGVSGLNSDSRITLSIVIDPSTNTAEAYYKIDDGSWQQHSDSFNVPQSWLDDGTAAGTVSTSIGASEYQGTWEYLSVATTS